jgi:hypothetical protein
LFTLEAVLGGMRMGNDGEVKMMVKDRFNGLAVDLYDARIQKLVTRSDNCPNLHRD